MPLLCEIPAEQPMLVPRQDYLLIEPSKPSEVTPGGIVLPMQAVSRTKTGRVIAAGPGMWTPQGMFIKTETQVGDFVVVTPFGQSYEVKHGGTEYFVCRDGDVVAVIPPAEAEAEPPAPMKEPTFEELAEGVQALTLQQFVEYYGQANLPTTFKVVDSQGVPLLVHGINGQMHARADASSPWFAPTGDYLHELYVAVTTALAADPAPPERAPIDQSADGVPTT